MEEKYESVDADECDSWSSSDDGSVSYGATAGSISRGFSRNAEFKVANGTDHYVMIGTEEERQKDEGGATVKLDIPSVFGVEYTLPKKDHFVVSGIRWQRADFHR